MPGMSAVYTRCSQADFPSLDQQTSVTASRYRTIAAQSPQGCIPMCHSFQATIMSGTTVQPYITKMGSSSSSMAISLIAPQRLDYSTAVSRSPHSGHDNVRLSSAVRSNRAAIHPVMLGAPVRTRSHPYQTAPRAVIRNESVVRHGEIARRATSVKKAAAKVLDSRWRFPVPIISPDQSSPEISTPAAPLVKFDDLEDYIDYGQ